MKSYRAVTKKDRDAEPKPPKKVTCGFMAAGDNKPCGVAAMSVNYVGEDDASRSEVYVYSCRRHEDALSDPTAFVLNYLPIDGPI